MLLTYGKLNFFWWAAIRDDFHLTQGNIASSPIGKKPATQQRTQTSASTGSNQHCR